MHTRLDFPSWIRARVMDIFHFYSTLHALQEHRFNTCFLLLEGEFRFEFAPTIQYIIQRTQRPHETQQPRDNQAKRQPNTSPGAKQTYTIVKTIAPGIVLTIVQVQHTAKKPNTSLDAIPTFTIVHTIAPAIVQTIVQAQSHP
jgi:hypothetical protein